MALSVISVVPVVAAVVHVKGQDVATMSQAEHNLETLSDRFTTVCDFKR